MIKDLNLPQNFEKKSRGNQEWRLRESERRFMDKTLFSRQVAKKFSAACFAMLDLKEDYMKEGKKINKNAEFARKRSIVP